MRGQWFYDIEEEYLASLAYAKEEFEEAQKEFEEAKDYLEEAKEKLAKFYKKYPVDYNGPAPLY